MQDYQDFTYDTKDYENLPTKVKEWKENLNIKWVPIIDAGIGVIEDD